jgi:DNA-binding NarL/FixJ family response regulator
MSSRPRPCGQVLVIDDDEGMRDLMVAVLGLGGLTVTTAATGEQGLELAAATDPHVVLLDVHLPGISGYAVCHELRKRAGDTIGILFVSGERTESFDRVAGLLIGGDDYLTKPFAPDELLERTRRLLRRLGTGTGNGNGARGVSSHLTPRELEVLRTLAEGLAQDGIAERLVISTKTVETHIEHILAKLGVHSRAQAVALAYREDLLSPPV